MIISHRHEDHTTGLTYLLKINPEVSVYVSKEKFKILGSGSPGNFYPITEVIEIFNDIYLLLATLKIPEAHDLNKVSLALKQKKD